MDRRSDMTVSDKDLKRSTVTPRGPNKQGLLKPLNNLEVLYMNEISIDLKDR
jgi:hypothetical protein